MLKQTVSYERRINYIILYFLIMRNMKDIGNGKTARERNIQYLNYECLRSTVEPNKYLGYMLGGKGHWRFSKH